MHNLSSVKVTSCGHILKKKMFILFTVCVTVIGLFVFYRYLTFLIRNFDFGYICINFPIIAYPLFLFLYLIIDCSVLNSINIIHLEKCPFGRTKLLKLLQLSLIVNTLSKATYPFDVQSVLMRN